MIWKGGVCHTFYFIDLLKYYQIKFINLSNFHFPNGKILKWDKLYNQNNIAYVDAFTN